MSLHEGGVLLWRGDAAGKDVANAYVYLEAAAGNNEPEAATWRDLVAKELTVAQKAEEVTKARSITTAQPPCAGSHGHQAWNLGLRLANLKVVDAVP